MIRRIIEINEELCNGCGLCANACHEGAIGMVDGKAKLLRDDYCDGLGNCLPACPTGAITFVEREATPFDEKAVEENMRRMAAEAAREEAPAAPIPQGCPGSRMRAFNRAPEQETAPAQDIPSQLRQWPVQIQLAPINAPYFSGANLLIAADCTAYAYGDFHRDYMRGKITLIGCPKLDTMEYTQKLTEIIRRNDIKSVTVTRMEVPCCGGIEHAVKQALQDSGKFIPWQVVTISTDGRILD